MSRPKIPVPLVDKIAQAFAAVSKLPRNGKNRIRGYPYTRASDVFEAVRHELLKRGVLCCPTEGEPKYIDIAMSNGGEQITECRLQVTYTFRDAAEKLEPMVVNGIGRDVEDKALYKAQTGAQKALLKRFGLMAEEADDPEFDGSQPFEGEGEDTAPRKLPRKEKPLAEYQIAAIREGMAVGSHTEEELSRAVAAIGHADALENVKRRYFKDLFKWASNGRGTITPPKLTAVPAQEALPLRAAPQPIQMKIGSKSIEFEPKDQAYSV
jgi:hypothetical protein